MSSQAIASVSRGRGRAYATTLKILWGVVIPGLLTIVALRFFVPDPHTANSDLLSQFLARIGTRYPTLLGAFVFLLTAYTLRTFQAYLPGGIQLTVAQKSPRSSRQALAIFCALLLLALGLRSSVFTSYKILSASMLPTLEAGDVVAVEKLSYGLQIPGLGMPFGQTLPVRGDVIVFRAPPGYTGPSELIKRVVGLPGDVIAMRGGHVIINGWEVPSCEAGPYAYITQEHAEISRIFFEFLEGRAYLATYAPMSPAWEHQFTVPAGHVFVLGDNRTSSEDSRAWNGGRGAGLPLGHILGRAERTLLGTSRNGAVDTAQVLKPLDWFPGKPLNLEGSDTATLERALEACASRQPADTSPPPPKR
ncbi:MAG: signal peptidase I [Polyangiaceae bacterium]|nr:signal peptidase I [Polyangiaceae bacterium]